MPSQHSARMVDLRLPATTWAGPGSLARAADVARERGVSDAFAFTDAAVAGAGHLDRLREVLGPVCDVGVFDACEPEPATGAIARAAGALAAARHADLIVSLGGGSVIDTAKCAMLVARNGGEILDYEDDGSATVAAEHLLPHLAIPTTAGTGSEATLWAVFVDPQRRCKTAVGDPRLVPDAAILDPELTATVPQAVTAATGMDALTHAIEAFVSVYATPITDALAARAITLIAANLPRVVDDGGDLLAREAMLYASYLAGAAFSNSSVGIAHSLSEALGGLSRVPHGLANALLLPAVMEFNAAAAPAAMAEVAALLGSAAKTEGQSAAAGAVHALRRRIGLPDGLAEAGVPRGDLPAAAALAFEWANDSGNPRTVTENELLELLEASF
jgi:alcohol dehydrogenase